MLAVHTILHPTDLSDRSQYAFWLAGALSRDYGARLIVLHVAEVPATAYGGVEAAPLLVSTDPEGLLAAAQKQLDRLQAPQANLRLERRVEQGIPVSEILRVAQETKADLIVMGTHGRTGLRRLLMGSVAEQVVRRAPCPVLTVKTPFPETVPAEDVAAEPALA